MNENHLFEIRRKIFHILIGITLASLLYYNIITAKIIFFCLLIGLALALLSMKIKIPVVWWIIETFERKNHLKTLPGKGMIAFFIGVLLAIKLFEPDIALASIMILTFGDSISHIIGITCGKIKSPLNGSKMIEGTIAGAIIAGIAASLFVNPIHAFLAAGAAMFFELIEIRLNQEILDDNIIVPLIAGTVILIARNYQTIFIL